jgi:hypothetical protein
MFLEIRSTYEDHGNQFVIGLAPTEASKAAPKLVVVHWNGVSTSVRDYELFDADRAMTVFESYLLVGRVPSKYSLRRLYVP